MIRIIKFNSGEMIVGECNEFVDFYTVDNPVSLIIDQYYEGDSIVETYEYRPWIPLSDTKKFNISKSVILAIAECNKIAIAKYNLYTAKTSCIDIHYNNNLH